MKYYDRNNNSSPTQFYLPPGKIQFYSNLRPFNETLSNYYAPRYNYDPPNIFIND